VSSRSPVNRLDRRWLAALVDDTEPDVVHRAVESPGAQQLGSPRVHEAPVEGLGEAFIGGVGDHPPVGGGIGLDDVDESLDQLVTAGSEPPQPGTVAGLVGLAELFAELAQLIDLVGRDPNQPVGQPGCDRRFAQCFDLGAACDVACIFRGGVERGRVRSWGG
jgi:hypothetical protein